MADDEKTLAAALTALEDAKGSIQRLEAKNSELLGKLKAAKGDEGGKLGELQDKIDELTESQSALKREYEKQIKTLSKERDDATTSATSEKNAVERLLLDNGLTEALTKANVRKEFLPAARALLKERGILSVKSEGDTRKAIAKLIKDGKESELDLGEYIEKHFASSDEGKAFIPAGQNSGGSSQGAGSSPRPSTMESLAADHRKAISERRVDDALAIKSKMQELQRTAG